MMMTKAFKVTFTEPVLGMACANPEVHKEHIASKAPLMAQTAEEAAVLEAQMQAQVESGEAFAKAKTVFPCDAEGVYVWDFQWRGFYKESLGLLIELGNESVKSLSKWTVKRAVDSVLFVTPRRIRFMDEAGAPIAACREEMTRPLRADTMQGPRICLATSDVLPPGTNLKFTVNVLEVGNAKSKLKITEEAVLEAMAYGSMRGWGQWRGAGFGRFTFEEEKE